jgi:hypothetical protein
MNNVGGRDAAVRRGYPSTRASGIAPSKALLLPNRTALPSFGSTAGSGAVHPFERVTGANPHAGLRPVGYA